MPLRGKHPGHKPYRLRFVSKFSGKEQTKSYHWRGPWRRDIETTQREGNLMGTFVRAWEVAQQGGRSDG